MLTETRQRKRRATVDMSPLIDVVFLLLIFFAVTTTFLEQSGMDLELPESSTVLLKTAAPIVVEISGGGEIRMDGEALTVDGLELRVTALSDEDRTKITVRADRSIDLGTWVQVIDALRKGGAEGISLPMVPQGQ